MTPTPAYAFCFGHFGCSSSGTTGTTDAAPFSVQSIGHFAQAASQVSLTGVQVQIWSIEDRLNCITRYSERNELLPNPCRQQRPSGTSRTAFDADNTAAAVVDSAFGALAYDAQAGGARPIYAKAPLSPTPAQSNVSFSVWGQGSYDSETRRGDFAGADIGTRTHTVAGIAGTDVTIQRVFSSVDALVFGLIGGDTAATTNYADGTVLHVRGPTVGVYSAYVNGGFSVDATAKTDFLKTQDLAPSGAVDLGFNNYVATANLGYKQYNETWWAQPTVGATYTRTVWNGTSKALGLTDGTNVRVQGGMRFGTSFDSGGVHFTPTLALLAYDDVVINGGTLAVATGTPLAPTDEGKVFGQAIGKLEAQVSKNLSTSIEGEVRGRANIYGLAGRIGATYSFD
ncbi:MAG TPA: hypothetical protein VEJ43_13675 [Pseudolabrys sp.]|nr:hypothetical protein [Pseudolabrys sp.]